MPPASRNPPQCSSISPADQGIAQSAAMPSIISSPVCAAGPSVELKCDITGRSTCVGEYDDFVHYFRDRYSKIREILSHRLNSRPIESLGRSSTGREVSLIGMVMDVKILPRAIG